MHLEKTPLYISQEKLINDQISQSKHEQKELKESIETNEDHTSIILDFFSGSLESCNAMKELLRKIYIDEDGYISADTVHEISCIDNSVYDIYTQKTMSKLFDICGNPKISLVNESLFFSRIKYHNAHYNPITNTMSLDVRKNTVYRIQGFFENHLKDLIITELTHAYQTVHDGAASVIGRGISNYLNPFSDDYNDPGNMEHDAHSVIEPALHLYFMKEYIAALETALANNEIYEKKYQRDSTRAIADFLKNVDDKNYLGLHVIQLLQEKDLSYFFKNSGTDVLGWMSDFLLEAYRSREYGKYKDIYTSFIEKIRDEGGMDHEKMFVDMLLGDIHINAAHLSAFDERITHLDFKYDALVLLPLKRYIHRHYKIIEQRILHMDPVLNGNRALHDKDYLLEKLRRFTQDID